MELQDFLPKLKDWFENYVEQFVSGDPNMQAALDLKRRHTLRVCEAILDVGRYEGLFGEDLAIAEASALLHDIGRFEQYRRYKTFSDGRSENHALLGVRVIQENRILEEIAPTKAQIIVRAVEWHNRAVLPSGESDRGLLFMKLLRDADKVDIWKVVTDYYQSSHRQRNPALELDLPDTPDISNGVWRSLMEDSIVRMTDLKSLNDFKLLQMGWIYDVNFPRTFQLVRERKYLERIRQALPEDSIRINEVYERAWDYLQRKTLQKDC